MSGASCVLPFPVSQSLTDDAVEVVGVAASWAAVVTAGPLPWSMAVASCSSSEDASSPELSSSSLQERK